MTGFWKINQIVTLGLFHFIGPANGYTCTPHIHSAITRLSGLVCFSRASFPNPVISWMRQWDPWRALHGRHGYESQPSNRETSFNAIQACFDLCLALVGPKTSPNSPNRGFKCCNAILMVSLPKLAMISMFVHSTGRQWNWVRSIHLTGSNGSLFSVLHQSPG